MSVLSMQDKFRIGHHLLQVFIKDLFDPFIDVLDNGTRFVSSILGRGAAMVQPLPFRVVIQDNETVMENPPDRFGATVRVYYRL